VAPPPGEIPRAGAPRPRAARSVAVALVAIAVAIVVTALTVVGIISWRTGHEAVPSSGPAVPGVTEAPPAHVDTDPPPLAAPIAATGNATFDAGATEVARFVEATRGHPFKEPVKVELVSEQAFNERLLADFDEGVGQIRRQEVALKALGMVSTNTDLVAEVRKLLSAGVLGFYDPKTKALVVRGTDLTPFTRQTLAHELTHALDDQWFDLDRPELDHADDEASFGFQALTEGSATWVQDAWTNSRSAAEQGAADAEAMAFARAADVGDLPPALVQIIESPYSIGGDLVAALVAHGGLGALDAAFRSPPLSSEQAMHPDRFRSGDTPAEVPIPTPDADQIDEGVMGELGLIQMLSTSLAPAIARRAAEGWGGDRYVVWKSTDGLSCLRDDMVTDSDADAAELEAAWRDWAAKQPSATVVVPSVGTIRLTTCR
jgi:hypothetical protein